MTLQYCIASISYDYTPSWNAGDTIGSGLMFTVKYFIEKSYNVTVLAQLRGNKATKVISVELSLVSTP